MADISAELAAIASAVYGEEVRDAIHDGLQKMNSDLNTAIGTQVIDEEGVKQVVASKLASEYSASESYEVGSYATYNGNLYRCQTAITGGESWTSGHWLKISVGDELYKNAFRYISSIGDAQMSMTSVTSMGCYSIYAKNRSNLIDAPAELSDSGTNYLYIFKVDKDNVVQWLISKNNKKLFYRLLNKETGVAGEWIEFTDNVATDSTLTVEGSAADAKVTGEKVRGLHGTILYEKTDVGLWRSGSISAATGEQSSNGNRIRTIYLQPQIKAVTPINGYSVAVFGFTAENTSGYVGCWNGKAFTTDITWFEDTVYLEACNPDYIYRITAKNSAGTSVSTSDGTSILFGYSTDESLSIAGLPADGEVAGAKLDALRNILKYGNAENVLSRIGIAAGIYTSGGRSWRYNHDESITISGAPTNVSMFTYFHDTSEIPSCIEKGKHYYVKIAPGNTAVTFIIQYYNGSWNAILSTNNEGSFLIPNESSITGISIRLRLSTADGTINTTIYPYIFNEKTNALLTSAIDDLSERMSYDGIPSYWHSYLDPKLSALQVNDFVHHSGDSFIFITDTHWEANAQNSPKLVEYITKNTSVKKVICGGDLITYHSNRAEAIAVINDFMTKFNNPYVACGNHDDNGEGSDASSSTRLSSLPRYGVITRKFNDKIEPYHTGKYSYPFFVIKNEADKMAYIVLDSTDYGYGSTQMPWLTNRINELYSTYNIVIVTHMHYEPLSGGGLGLHDGTGKVLEDTLAALTSSALAKVVAIFCGHVHSDAVYRTSTGIPVIISQCDAYEKVNARSPYTMTAGTATEQCFDIVYIDTDTSNIYLTRIGAGIDRVVPFRT